MVESFVVQIVIGIYLGVLTGIIPALVAMMLGFTFKYFTGFTVPGLGVVVLATALAGVSGGLMGLIDPAISNTLTGLTALLVVLMMALWAHGNGDKLGANFPKRITLQSIRERTLSADVIERVGTFGQVRIRISGPIGDMENYPALPEPVRQRLAEDSWTFPADLSIAELEKKLADKLLADYDLADASVSIDSKGNATVAAAPTPGGLSRRLSSGRRAVSIETIVPTGVAHGDAVTIRHSDGEITGIVVSAKSGNPAKTKTKDDTDTEKPEDELIDKETTATTVTNRATGGKGRLTLSVTPRDARRLLSGDVSNVMVGARGKRREFELVSLLKKAGNQFRKIKVADGSPIAGKTLGDGRVRDTYGVGVLAIRRSTERIVAPRGQTVINSGDELYIAGTRESIASFEEAVT